MVGKAAGAGEVGANVLMTLSMHCACCAYTNMVQALMKETCACTKANLFAKKLLCWQSGKTQEVKSS